MEKLLTQTDDDISLSHYESRLHLLTSSVSAVVSLQGMYQRRLYQKILRDYNPLVRPVYNDSDALTVEFGLNLMQIIDVVRQSAYMLFNDKLLEEIVIRSAAIEIGSVFSLLSNSYIRKSQ